MKLLLMGPALKLVALPILLVVSLSCVCQKRAAVAVDVITIVLHNCVELLKALLLLQLTSSVSCPQLLLWWLSVVSVSKRSLRMMLSGIQGVRQK